MTLIINGKIISKVWSSHPSQVCSENDLLVAKGVDITCIYILMEGTKVDKTVPFILVEYTSVLQLSLELNRHLVGALMINEFYKIWIVSQNLNWKEV